MRTYQKNLKGGNILCVCEHEEVTQVNAAITFVGNTSAADRSAKNLIHKKSIDISQMVWDAMLRHIEVLRKKS